VPAPPSTCAICGKNLEANAARESPLYPFCSKRCKQVDLLRWCDGRYAVVNELDPEALMELGDGMFDSDEGSRF
jgi:endogenous inhibitor of DNA gyrase (YacG/DUF329 family)